MSAPPKQSKAESKRARTSDEPADPAATSGEEEDRSVRQRIDTSSSSSGTVGSSFAAEASFAADSSASSVSSATLIRPSLMRLAVVERQLIMQALDLTSLARLASTCKQMRGGALHKEAGKFIPTPSPYSALGSQCRIDEDHSAHASPLFRMHVPVRLSFTSAAGALTSAEREALIIKAANFSRITEISSLDDQWTESQALQRLAQPWIQSVRRVETRSSVWLRSSAVQHALFALPQLISIRVHFREDMADCELLESALSQASKLASAHILIHSSRALDIRCLRALPALTALKLVALGGTGVEPLGPLVWCLPPTITSLTLVAFSLKPDSTPRSVLKAMFLRLPRLQVFHTEWDMEIAPVLQGMLDAGVGALPDLRRVQFDNGVDDDPDLLRRFLHKFTEVTVRFFLAHDSGEEGLYEALRMARWYGRWPRVEVDPEATNDPPLPHPSDDESESDVEAAVDPLANDQ